MRIVFFCHSIISDWNHGNAHFLRGIATELINLGHDVTVYEPRHGWSIENLVQAEGDSAVAAFHAAFPALRVVRYNPAALDLDAALSGVSLAVVHEWNEPRLVETLGAIRSHRNSFVLLFHDTHHRSVSDGAWNPPLDGYDGALAFGESLRDLYLRRGWAARVWTWHEAADTSRFCPMRLSRQLGDLVWIGNWGDGERSSELTEYLLKPVKDLGIGATVYGVRYPAAALEALSDSRISYAGWTPNYRVPEIFSRFRLTVHIPRAPYLEALRGIPTIRVFEALACGIPLISAPWDDCEHLFSPNEDFLVARNCTEMENHIRMLLHEPETARALAEHGVKTVQARHSCSQRALELLSICASLRKPEEQPEPA
jgi:spore maturation protein CgeB